MASQKCVTVLEALDNEQKQDVCKKESIRSLVGCVASQKRSKDGVPFGQSMKLAWKEAKEFCAEQR